ncbi:homocysteine S-methyltransferase [Halarcobacter sp.]|uniref:homocysteine S-methyltransferase n=1 Tax=Halarcobacter sp. TaxID=2321133 RepID=UPI0029F5BCA4|nr:homocysteine S-methyltransferase [Halarcobacter sp.]
MNQVNKILEKQALLILDGALGTRLQEKGFDINDSLWSAKFLNENPKALQDIHTEYLNAGADCIITSSYQASIEGFVKKGFDEKTAKNLLILSIQLAKDARDEFWEENKSQNRIKPLVAASIGPYGAYLADGSEYSGNYKISDEELKEFHKNRLEIIARTNPDIFAVETIPSLKEAKIICELLKDFKDICSWISFSAKDSSFTNAGDDIETCVKYLDTQEHISAIGINCTSPQYIQSLVKKIKKSSNKNIVVYPNGGAKYNPLIKQWESSPTDEKEFAKMANLWKNEGANIIGGCCQTGPKEIKELRKTLKSNI